MSHLLTISWKTNRYGQLYLVKQDDDKILSEFATKYILTNDIDKPFHDDVSVIYRWLHNADFNDLEIANKINKLAKFYFANEIYCVVR